MTIGGFYKHFESKDALVEEVFSLTFEQSSVLGAKFPNASTTIQVFDRLPIVDYI